MRKCHSKKIKHSLYPRAVPIVLLFALANSGMHIGRDFFRSLINAVGFRMMVDLVVGKFAQAIWFTEQIF